MAVGTAADLPAEIDLVIQPERFAERSLPGLIADTYLEWESARGVTGGA